MIVLEAIARVNRELGTTTAVITHNQVISQMADRVISLSDGQVSGIEQNLNQLSASELNW
jgi:putative ABC transport system ATP-binding protein